MTLRHRGPDASYMLSIPGAFLGFHRLAIVGTHHGQQPFCYRDEIYVLCNGEIYNHEDIKKQYDFRCETQSDCEVIIHLYKLHGVKILPHILDGVYAIVIYDRKKNTVYSLRDITGVRPLYYSHNNTGIVLSSELGQDVDKHIVPRKIHIFDLKRKTVSAIPSLGFAITSLLPHPSSRSNTHGELQNYLRRAVYKRLNCEKKIGFFLSGGLDSSIILALAMEYFSIYPPGYTINVFTVGTEKSTDAIFADTVFSYLSKKYCNIPAKLTLIKFSADEGFSMLPEVIKHLGSYDTTTIRAGVPMYICAKYAAAAGIKVIISGEGSDELFGGYLYCNYAGDSKSHYAERVRLLENLYLYDNLRVDRMTAAHSLEVRVPFLDKALIHYVMADKTSHFASADFPMEKRFLREAFAGMLPEKVLWRQKEALSDGCGYDWMTELRERCKPTSAANIPRKPTLNSGKTTPRYPEEHYFRALFDKIFPEKSGILREFWQPKFIDTHGESSARAIPCHCPANRRTSC